MQQEDDVNVGFLRMRLGDSGYRCGLLVLDGEGMPLELRATDPIKPTSTQKIAYGNTLLQAIASVSGEPLLNALQENPDILFVDAEEFLSLHSDELPTVFVKAHGEEFEIDRNTERERGTVIEDKAGKFKPVKLNFPQSASQEERDELRRLAQRVYAEHGLDITEPFQRIERALEVLDKQQG